MNIRGLLSKKGIPWFLGVVVLILLGIMSIPVAFASKESGVIAFTVPVVVLLVFSMAMKVFVMKTFNGKIAWYVLDGALLLLLTLVSNWQNESGNLISYNYIMCALVLSEFYLSSPSLRDNVIMFCVIAGAYTVAYIIIAIRNNFINSAFRTAAQYFTDLIILLLHFVMFNFAMTVYRKNKIIEEKVRELEDSRNELLRAHGYKVEERRVSIGEVIAAQENGTLNEAFGTGTAAVISPVGMMEYKGKDYVVNGGEMGRITKWLYDTITGIQTGRLEDKFGWVVKL